MPDSLPPQTLAWLRQSAAVDGAAYSQVLLHLLDHVEVLEWRSTCKQALQVPPTPEAAPVAMQSLMGAPMDARGYVDLRNPPPPAPAGGLVERVCRQLPLRPVEARAVIRLVAAWLDQQGQHGCSLLLREEVEG